MSALRFNPLTPDESRRVWTWVSTQQALPDSYVSAGYCLDRADIVPAGSCHRYHEESEDFFGGQTWIQLW